MEERRQLEELQAKAREKEELKQKIQNLKESATELRSEISQGQAEVNGVMDNVTVGEADKGLDFDGRLEEVLHLFPAGDPSAREMLTQEQMTFLSSLHLERAEVLTGRVQAYRQHNAALEQRTRELKSKSRELEERYKKIVSLCTKVDVGNVDQVLDSPDHDTRFIIPNPACGRRSASHSGAGATRSYDFSSKPETTLSQTCE